MHDFYSDKNDFFISRKKGNVYNIVVRGPGVPREVRENL